MTVRLRTLSNNSTNVRTITMKRLVIHALLNLSWRIAPALAVGLVKKHVFRPAGYRTSIEEEQFLDTGSKFQIDIHGKTVQGWKWGEGPSVLFVHGWNGRGIQFKLFFEPLVEAGYTVIIFDAPAHGDSGGKTSSYFEWTDTIRAVLSSPNGFNVKGLIGHSLGGSAVINALSKKNISIPAVLIAPVFRLEEILFNTFRLYGIPERVYHRAIEEYEHRFGYTLKNANPGKLLQAIDAELLVIHDRQDQAIPFRDSSETARTWPHVMLHVTTGLGHRRILSDRDTVDFATDYMINQIESSKMPQLGFEDHPRAVRQIGKISAVI